MQNEPTWRQALAVLIADHTERNRLAQQLGIHPMTLTRWSNGISQPRLDLLRTFVQILPASQENLRTLLIKEYPDLFSEENSKETQPPTIPSPFYARILRAHISLPIQLREASVSLLILQQMLMHLDPRRLGLMVFLARGIPETDGRIHCLRQTLVRATTPWERLTEQQDMEQQTIFFGMESLPGYSMTTGRISLISHIQGCPANFPPIAFPEEKSALAVPLLLADSVTGCLCALSSQAHFFKQEYIDLIQEYADVLTTILPAKDFYPLSSIELSILPDRKIQWSFLKTFQQRVMRRMLANNITRIEAEQHVWHDIEKELRNTPQLFSHGMSS